MNPVERPTQRRRAGLPVYLKAALLLLAVMALPGAAVAQQWTGCGANNTSVCTSSASANVGVGTTAAPLEKLDINGGVRIAGPYTQNSPNQGVIDYSGNYLRFVSGGPNPSTAGGFSFFGVNSTGSAINQVLTINNQGNVGVGTSSPGAKLEVNRGGSSGEAVRAFSGNANNYVYYGVGRTSLEAVFGVAAGPDQFFAGAAAGDFIVNAQNTTQGQRIFFGVGTTPALVMTTTGVGVGTTTPNASYKLDINGGVNVTGALHTTGAITADGAITGATVNALYQDVAEWVPSTQKLRAGTVVVLDTTQSNHVLASMKAYDTGVAGVISDNPGVILGQGGGDKVKVATTGRVKVRVDATRAPIRVGDLLVTSEAEGVAMKSVPVDLGGVQIHRPGTIIGKALEPLANGRGEILVLLSLQ
jgi:Tfp pilus assembly protein FimT